MSESLCFLSATELADAIRHKRVSPVDITSAVLARAERLQPELNCFITIDAERAMESARQAERLVMAGGPLGLLHGVPFTVKDIVNTQGVRTTFGAAPLRDNVPQQDAVAVARLREQGAILIGKTTTPEFGSKCLTDSPLFGRTRNAWSAQRTSGGSSGGAAVAVASGIAPLAVATDGGGSTRIPAACNGVVGIKQSNGVIPHSQAQDLYGNQTYVTPTTRTVADTGLMMAAMAGEHACDPWSIGVPKADYVDAARAQGDLRGKRILYCLAPPGRPVAADVARAFERGLAALAGLGAELEPFDGDGFNDIEPLWRAINHTVWRTRFVEIVERHRDELSATFVRQVESAAQVSGVAYQQAMFDRSRLFQRVQALLERADLLAMPTIMRTALPIDQDLFGTIEIDGHVHENVRANWFPWTMPFNMTGHPAISLPCGFGSDDLPIGLQLVGRFRRDTELLRCAALFESAHGFLDRWPSL
ncbi:aspartyl-tRNA(Asn)/glutamyl-tRNA(Gln) amidotransferase subunit A [Cupriavidus metallidurans]|jgi:aspartyl-tRNA(Asn)/glutamyl-tRNA(Gln) amidotransferase subunit A|uniref:Asp-tRNA Asn / Glu-tRNA Gln amidotransferase A subunit or related amidase n=1 Tax=Cupriavidus metallidurans (strain ATCC 43123 / DSM 2839 / NBRC 102507 / CH34) TaxID=266264 RepID=Q1LMH7_CUPMC|nr:amidase [Cupriavidus metallidurans]ABF08649.1 Asp-tRNA Asn / Glu-tRNA Gln amidotransferase A subunit or related amidase [Cupriavidus metallidurans CH34]AVA35903.1 amidase [Cupriavidus metallidurans]KWW38068.1 Acylamidase [Cupriavidus metallidurans]MDE4917987.1 amidase [Cupriavidus metallidurans]QGS30423.1 amidase [Cupriavidus metallidurans]